MFSGILDFVDTYKIPSSSLFFLRPATILHYTLTMMMILNNLSPRSTLNDYISFQIYSIPISFFFFNRSWREIGEMNACSGLSRSSTWFPCRACFIEEAAISRPPTWYGKRVEMHRVSREVPSAWFPSPRLVRVCLLVLYGASFYHEPSIHLDSALSIA